ncbi:MAG: SipW-dependent-type signal peptide-containing protein [Bacilli bacterium]|nr:SipW-dependent-type signal peptide-containing protein [Bacilli bacterium]
MNKKLIAPIVSIAALAAVTVGTTYALFTDKKSAEIDITAGRVKVDMSATVDFALSRYEDLPPFDAVANAISLGGEHTAVYENGNTADLSNVTTGVSLVLDRMTPMDNIGIKINVANTSNVTIKWRAVVETEGELIPALDILFDGEDYSTEETEKIITYSRWSKVEPSTTSLISDAELYVAFPDHDEFDPEFDNGFQEKAGSIKISVEAVQGNAVTQDPQEKKFGFDDSYIVDEGLETQHWVHEISNADEFRNILDSSVHSGKSGRLDYPGAGEKETEYLLNSDIDFGGLCWNTAELLDDVKANAFVGILDTVDGYPVTLSNIHVNAKTGSRYKGSDSASAIICLFDRIYDAKISNLILDDMTLDDTTAKVGALLALGNEGTDKEYLEITNVTTNPNCYVNISASAGGLVALLRNYTDHASFVNCVNNANVSGSLTSSGTNIGGIISQSSLVGNDFTITFENCTNNGNISGGFCIGGLAGSLSEDGLVKNCINTGDITCTDGNDASTGAILTHRVCGSFIGAYTVNTTLSENVYDIEMIDSLNKGTLYVGDDTLPIVDFAYGPTYYEVNGVKVDNPTLEEFKSLFVVKYTNVNIPMSFGANDKLQIEAPQGVTVAKYVLSLRFTTTYVSRSAGKSTAQTQANDLATIEILPEDLESFELQKINQIGYFAPDETCEVPEYVQSNPNVKTKKDALKYGFIDYTYHGLADLTPGYHSNYKGGYVVWDTTGTVGDLYLAPYIWGNEQKCIYNIIGYDANNKTVATGTLDGGVIVSGIVTYGGTEWIPQ